MTARTRGEIRRDAVEACQARFGGRPLSYGSRDCVKLAGHAMHKLGVKVGLTKGVRYSTAAGALKAMKKSGFNSLIEAMDATPMYRIPPASALGSDILALPSDDAFGCSLWVCIGGRAALGYIDGQEAAVPVKLETAPLIAWSRWPRDIAHG